MAIANDTQVQHYADERIRPACEAAVAVGLRLQNIRQTIDDVYNALNVQSPTWSDQRTDGPPHLLAPSDVLAINAFCEDIKNAILNHGQYPIVLKACVRPVGG